MPFGGLFFSLRLVLVAASSSVAPGAKSVFSRVCSVLLFWRGLTGGCFSRGVPLGVLQHTSKQVHSRKRGT